MVIYRIAEMQNEHAALFHAMIAGYHRKHQKAIIAVVHMSHVITLYSKSTEDFCVENKEIEM